MILDVDFQIISGCGWMELQGNTVKTRKNGEVINEELTPSRMHIHEDGVNITLPPKLLKHLVDCVNYYFNHDQHGNPLPNPVATPIRIVIRS